MENKTIFMNIRATPKERERWNKLAEARGTKVSKIIRAHLDRLCKKDGIS